MCVRVCACVCVYVCVCARVCVCVCVGPRSGRGRVGVRHPPTHSHVDWPEQRKESGVNEEVGGCCCDQSKPAPPPDSNPKTTASYERLWAFFFFPFFVLTKLCVLYCVLFFKLPLDPFLNRRPPHRLKTGLPGNRAGDEGWERTQSGGSVMECQGQ